MVVKRIFKYLKGTEDYRLWYPKVEYIATISCSTQFLWIKQTLQDIQVEYDDPILIFCDNTSVISISKNPVMNFSTL
jgi:hypothetical protein